MAAEIVRLNFKRTVFVVVVRGGVGLHSSCLGETTGSSIVDDIPSDALEAIFQNVKEHIGIYVAKLSRTKVKIDN